ncbi:hypothetical protein LPMP_356630 [Leishmania panamensis]|uniref:Uncharacterized protein n=1 Tax=Leishmania panamensis TaxID=5679 RepID=A0A088S3M6_LEIPA|nr:hypothetical protein LPMP_356630 [Leishmania panamensis]AIO02791.1 hypothetical protein LPMP_356630 [Leishmania panamensis]
MQRCKCGVSSTTSGAATHHSLLEMFLRERLENWDREAAEAIVAWGRVGGMCSSEYQSQLRKAQATLRETHKEEKRREASVFQAGDGFRTDRYRRLRDRLATEFWTHTQVKLDATPQQRDRQLRTQAQPQANGQTPVSRSPTPQLTPPSCSRQLLRALKDSSTSASSQLTTARAHHMSPTPALRTSPPCSSRGASGGDVAQRGAPRAHKSEAEASNGVESERHTKPTVPLNEHDNVALPGAGSDGSSRLLLSAAGEREVSAAASTPAETPPKIDSFLSETFVVRRLSTHSHLSPSLVEFKHTVQRSHIMLDSSRPVAPPPPQPAHQIGHRWPAAASDVAREDSAGDKGSTPPSVSPGDPSLPHHSRAKPPESHRRRSARERCVNSSARTERSRGEPDADAQEGTPSALSHIISFKRGSHTDDLRSVSSAESYLDHGDHDGR